MVTDLGRTWRVPGAAIAALAAATVACGGAGERPQPDAAATPFAFAERVGWLHGPCLAIANSALSSGTSVVLVITAEPQRVERAQIEQRTSSGERCQPLMEGRGAKNAKPDMSFYALTGAKIDRSDMGFGLVAAPADPRVVNGLVQVDLDRNGQPEVFASCATAEGIQFSVWSGKAYQGEPRWTGYYYLDYDLTPTCP